MRKTWGCKAYLNVVRNGALEGTGISPDAEVDFCTVTATTADAEC
jgi:hypothetical protein